MNVSRDYLIDENGMCADLKAARIVEKSEIESARTILQLWEENSELVIGHPHVYDSRGVQF